MNFYVKRQSRTSTYSDYRIHMNTYGAKLFATAYTIEEAVLLAAQITDKDFTATAIHENGKPVTESDIRSLYFGFCNVETLVDALYKSQK